MKLEVGKTYRSTVTHSVFTICAKVGDRLIGYWHPSDEMPDAIAATWMDADCGCVEEYTPPRTLTGYINVYPNGVFSTVAKPGPNANHLLSVPTRLATLEITYTESDQDGHLGEATVKVLP